MQDGHDQKRLGCLPVDYTRFCQPINRISAKLTLKGIHKASAFLRFEVVIP